MFVLLLVALAVFDGQTVEEIVKEQNLAARVERLERLRQQTDKAETATQVKLRLAMAGAENSLGRYEEARRHALEAVTLLDKAPGAEAVRQRSQALNHIGNAYLYQSRYPEALENYEASLRAAQEGKFDDLAALRWNNIGTVHYFAGNYAAAWGAYEEAAQVVSRHETEAWARKAYTTTLVNKATIRQRLNRYREALQLYQLVRQQIAKDPLSSAGPVADAQLLANTGALYRRLGDPYKALQAEEEALRLFERAQYRDGILGTLSSIAMTTFQDLDDRVKARRLFKRILEAAQQAKSTREETVARLNLGEIDLVENRRDEAQAGFSLCLEAARRANLAEEEWRALFGLARLALAQNERRRAVVLLEQAAAKIADIEQRIQPGKERIGFLIDKRQALDLLIELRLGENKFDDSLLELIESSHSRSLRTRRTLPGLATLQRSITAGTTVLLTWTGPQRTALIPLTRDTARIYWLEAGTRSRAVRSYLARFPDSPFFPPLAARLESIAEVQAARRLLVIPDQWLGSIPWASPASARESAVQLLPSVTLLELESKQLFRWPWQPTSLAVAVAQPDPQFIAADGNDLPPLPLVAAEAEELSRRLPGKNVLLKDKSATKAAVLAAMPRFAVLHIAAHSVADPADAGHSRLLLQDAPLFASELAGLPLDQLELVVLSACSSAQGEMIAGEGLEGLTSTFLKAGAANVVGTLWPVPDQIAAQWSKAFYQHLGASEPLEVAVAMANRAIDDPVHRYAFVLWGNGGLRLKTFPWWPSVMAVAMVAIAAVVLPKLSRARKRES